MGQRTSIVWAVSIAGAISFCGHLIGSETPLTNIVSVSSLGERVVGAGDLKPGGTSKLFFGDAVKYSIQRRVRVDSGKVPFVLVHGATVSGESVGDTVHQAAVSLTTGDAYCTAWYCAGWWTWDIPGVNRFLPLGAFRILESGRRGLVEQVWTTTNATVCARYLVYPGDNKLMVEWTMEGPRPSNDCVLTLSALPGIHQSLATGREVTTAVRSISDNARNTQVDLTREWWMVCSDRIHTKGTCALVFPKEGFAKVLVSPEGLISIRATPVRGVNRLRMAFWDFPDKDRAWTEKHIREFAQKARDDLSAARFECTSAFEFNVDTEQKALTHYIHSTWRSKASGQLKTAQVLGERYNATPLLTSLWEFEGAVRNYRYALRGLRRTNGNKLNVVTLAGVGGGNYGLPQVFDKMGIQGGTFRQAVAKVTASCFFKQSLEGFPAQDELPDYDCVVLADADMWALLRDGQTALMEFVRNGGGLVVLGGNSAYGHSRVIGPLATDALPVEIKDPFDLELLPEGKVVLKGRGGEIFGALDWKKQPVVYWHHRLTLKPDAEVLALWNDIPLVIGGKYGEGRVVVFTGTFLGLPDEKTQTPIWKWDDSPSFLSQMIFFACGRTD